MDGAVDGGAVAHREVRNEARVDLALGLLIQLTMTGVGVKARRTRKIQARCSVAR